MSGQVRSSRGRLECVVYERATTAGDSGEGDETAREAVAARDACLLLRWWYEVGNRRVRRCCQNKQTKLESQQRLPNRRAPTPKLQPHAAVMLRCWRYVQVLMLAIINIHKDGCLVDTHDYVPGLRCTRGAPARSASRFTTSSNRATTSLPSGLLIQGSTSWSCRSFRVSFLRGVCFGGDRHIEYQMNYSNRCLSMDVLALRDAMPGSSARWETYMATKMSTTG